MPNDSKNGGLLQSLQTILVAFLLGVSGWLATATIQNREEAVRLRAQFDERKEVIARIENTLSNTVATQQDVLRTLIRHQQEDEKTEAKVEAQKDSLAELKKQVERLIDNKKP